MENIKKKYHRGTNSQIGLVQILNGVRESALMIYTNFYDKLFRLREVEVRQSYFFVLSKMNKNEGVGCTKIGPFEKQFEKFPPN